MSTSKLNHEGVLLLEQPFTRVPYEQYRKVFRASQRHIERELGAVQIAATELVKKSTSGSVDAAEAVKALDGMMARVEGLKRKLSDLHENATVPVQRTLRNRLTHLAELDSLSSTDDERFNQWADIRLGRWLADWALRNGKGETARQIAKSKGIQDLVDIDLFRDIYRIEYALNNHSCTEALAWCSENKTSLRKMKNSLEFDLRLQEFIELARVGKSTEAITHSKKYLTSWQEMHDREIPQAMALLAHGPRTKIKSYQRLYDPSRWTDLIRSFRDAAYSLNTLPTDPLLNLSLYAGLASLKLPACYDSVTKSVDCPVCDSTGLGQLATEVPWSHHVNSTIVCSQSGKIMDEDNPPMCFPNGRVYSREVLEKMAARNDGQVTCPRTNQTCAYTMLRKVFIS